MRTIGPNTLAAIESLIYQQAYRVSVYDEGDTPTEYVIPYDAVLGYPRVQTDLDKVAWQLSISILKNFPTAISTTLAGVNEMSDIIAKGRRIVVTESMAPGEELTLFDGIIADVPSKDDYSEGFKQATWAIEAFSPLSSAWRAWCDRISHDVTLIHPDSRTGTPATGRIGLTGIVKTYRLTIPFTDSSAKTFLISSITGTSNSYQATVDEPTGFAVDDEIFLVGKNGVTGVCVPIKLTSVNSITRVITFKTSAAIDSDHYGVNSWLYKASATIAIKGAYFSSTLLEGAVSVYNSEGTLLPSGWKLCLEEMESGLPVIFFHSVDPGVTFTIDICAVDRWVILSRRWHIDGTTASTITPVYYLLDGIAGQDGAEKLANPAYTTIRADKPHTDLEVWVNDPSGIFATVGSNSRYMSVWSNGREYRGRVATVDKQTGQVTFVSTRALRDYQGNAPTLTGGEQAGNTSTLYYEILDPRVKPIIYDTATNGNNWHDVLRFEPNGGFFTWSYGNDMSITMIAYYNGITGYWYLENTPVVAPSAGSFDPVLDVPGNDAASFISNQLTAVGVDLTGASIAMTGYTLAPVVLSGSSFGDAIDAMRKEVIPPNYRLRTDEMGKVIGAYITQKTTADMTIKALQGLEPQEPAEFYTRVVIKGKEQEVNRAGQLLDPGYSGLKNIVRVVDGLIPQYQSNKAHATLTAPIARIPFKAPQIEDGRWPSVSRVAVTFTPDLLVNVGIADTISNTVRWLSPGREIQNIDNEFVTREFSGFEAIAKSDLGDCYIIVEATSAPPYPDSTPTYNPESGIGEIQVWIKEGAYAEAMLTSDTNKAPADQGTANFGTVWNQPDRTKNVFYKYVPPAVLRRNKTWFGSGNGVDRANVVTAEGITGIQAVELAQVSIDMQLLGAEFYKCPAMYDPRVQPRDTVEILYFDSITQTWGSKLLLVWGILKEGPTMELTLANYNR